MTAMHEKSENGLCRRAILIGAGGLGVTTFLAACGGSSETSDGAKTGEGETNATQAASPSVTESAALAKVTDVPVGSGKLVGSVLLVQPQAGVIKAFDAHCTHQGTIVNVPQAGVITCPLHGSQFKAEDGSLVRGPATRGLTPIAVKVTDGEIIRI